jgi:tRNA dimethylallyltransferase
MARSGFDKAILIAGPTASGKSGVALRLARELDGVVVNADAMQVYRDLSILTARPDKVAEAEAPHRLYGHVDAGERYSVGRWLGEFRAVLDDLAAAGRWAVITGGTGLYFKALTEGLADIPAIAADIEKHWQARLTAEGPGALHDELRRADPQGAGTVGPSDSQRLVRALAVLAATGQPLRSFHGEGNGSPLPGGPSRRLVVMPPRAGLYRHIEARFDAMIAEGAVAEVETLLARRLDPRLPALKAIGVAELGRYLAGDVSLDAAIIEAKTRSRRFAKRQMTWVRGQMASWPAVANVEDAIALARQLAAWKSDGW